MKPFLIILTCILYKTAFCQFGVIADKDGFVNVRNSPNPSAKIIDTISNGHIVFCLESEGNWRPIDYNFFKLNKTGYVHQSRVKLLESFTKIAHNKLTDNLIEFKKDSFSLTVTKTNFIPSRHNLKFERIDNSKTSKLLLKTINGREIWGTDGNTPKTQYGQMTLSIGANKTKLPIDNLFEPNLEATAVFNDQQNDTIYISAMNSDGAGGYAVLWVIEKGVFKRQIKTTPF